jgi:hypothetical protein
VDKVNPLDNISNSESSTSKKIIALTNISDLIRIATTSIKKISTVLSSDWEKVSYPKNLEPLNEWYSYKSSDQLIESYIGWDNGIKKDIRITSFEFSQKKLLDEILLQLSNSDFTLVEKTKDYYNFTKNNNVIEVSCNNNLKSSQLYKIEISTVVENNLKSIGTKKI